MVTLAATTPRLLKPCKDHGQKGMAYGYGTARVPVSMGMGRVTTSAHRLAYCKDKGVSLASIAGLDVMHHCDNSRCVEPEHLAAGTHSANQLDAQRRGNGYSIFRDGYRARRTAQT